MKNSYKLKRRYKRSDRFISQFTAFSNEQTKNHRRSSSKFSQQNVTIEIFRFLIQSMIQNVQNQANQTKSSQSIQTQISIEAEILHTRTKKTIFENRIFQSQRRTRNKKKYKNQIKITESDDKKKIELSVKRSASIQFTRSILFAASFSTNSIFFVSTVNMMKLNSNTEEIEFLFHDELTEEFTVNSNAFIMIHRLKNFRRSSEFSKHITF